jgi:release factor glutamine methyltransferase
VINLRAALGAAVPAIAALPHASPRREAEWLLCAVLDRPCSYLAAWPEQMLTPVQQATFERLLQRRLAGEPVAYLLGQQGFWSLTLQVTPAVLIPRPETELLVELALAEGDRQLAAPLGKRPLTVADLGTGSGAIAAALAHERPTWHLYATDLSAAALAVAMANFRRLNLPVQTYLGPWYAALPPALRLDIIVSNPPYIQDDDRHLQQGDLIWEPTTALMGGADGLESLRTLCVGAVAHLRPGGAILLEHGYDQGETTRILLEQAGFQGVRTWCDLAGHERVSGGRR